jgi:hypothetical protein
MMYRMKGLETELQPVLEALREQVQPAADHQELEAWFASLLTSQFGKRGSPAALAALIAHFESQAEPADALILDFLRGYRITRTARRRKGTRAQIAEASSGSVSLSPAAINQIALRQNSGRGKTFEQMALVLILDHFDFPGDEPPRVLLDQAVFEAGERAGRIRKRRIDIYFPDHKLAFEVKSGRVSLDRKTRAQIEKDRYLLDTGVVDRVWWLLFYGGSASLIRQLERQGIRSIDLALNDYD